MHTAIGHTRSKDLDFNEGSDGIFGTDAKLNKTSTNFYDQINSTMMSSFN